MQNDFMARDRVGATGLRGTLDSATRASFLLLALAALAACNDAPSEPSANLPASGPQTPSAAINILPARQTFPAPIAFVTGSPLGAEAKVRAYDKTGNLMAEFNAFTQPQDFTAGVEVALADMNNDGYPDIIAGEGPTPGAANPSRYAVWNGRTGAMMGSGQAYWNSFRGGVRVGAGDFDGDGIKEVYTCLGPSGGPADGQVTLVNVYKLGKGYPYTLFGTGLGDPTTKAWMVGGCRIAGGDINGDGRDDVIATFHGTVNSLVISDAATKAIQVHWSPLGAQYTSQISVAAGDMNGDKKADVFLTKMAALTGKPPVWIYDGSKFGVAAPLPAPTVVTPFNLWWATGLTIAARDFDGDGLAELFAKPTTMLGQSGLSIFKAPTFTSYILSIVEKTVQGNGGPIG